MARAAPHLAPFSQTGDVLTASGGHYYIFNIISPFCDQIQPLIFSEERSCSCQCEAEFPTFREDTSACVETVQGGFREYGCDDVVGRVDEDENIRLCCNKAR